MSQMTKKARYVKCLRKRDVSNVLESMMSQMSYKARFLMS